MGRVCLVTQSVSTTTADCAAVVSGDGVSVSSGRASRERQLGQPRIWKSGALVASVPLVGASEPATVPVREVGCWISGPLGQWEMLLLGLLLAVGAMLGLLRLYAVIRPYIFPGPESQCSVRVQAASSVPEADVFHRPLLWEAPEENAPDLVQPSLDRLLGGGGSSGSKGSAGKGSSSKGQQGGSWWRGEWWPTTHPSESWGDETWAGAGAAAQEEEADEDDAWGDGRSR